MSIRCCGTVIATDRPSSASTRTAPERRSTGRNWRGASGRWLPNCGAWGWAPATGWAPICLMLPMPWWPSWRPPPWERSGRAADRTTRRRVPPRAWASSNPRSCSVAMATASMADGSTSVRTQKNSCSCCPASPICCSSTARTIARSSPRRSPSMSCRWTSTIRCGCYSLPAPPEHLREFCTVTAA